MSELEVRSGGIDKAADSSYQKLMRMLKCVISELYQYDPESAQRYERSLRRKTRVKRSRGSFKVAKWLHEVHGGSYLSVGDITDAFDITSNVLDRSIKSGIFPSCSMKNRGRRYWQVRDLLAFFEPEGEVEMTSEVSDGAV